ncbi:hypothetical protein FISHEDRAFT_44682 [Fistulina hepatica ATCC 64428]|uniref:Uncharacterized protein n=1 Tax=Fistulina hepatica ATCC 64428 TaxID=1128425 RepID=A0A0D7A9T5_9AGAR|nr:hypothetical protein FISHEDRAFT_44682 [Fistulina hepatica ATCC 64428]
MLTDDHLPSVETLYQQALAQWDDSAPDESPLSSPLTTPPSSRPESPQPQTSEVNNSPGSPQPAPGPRTRKQRSKAISKLNRKRRREQEPLDALNSVARKKYIQPSTSRAVHVEYDTRQAKTMSTAFTAARPPPTPGRDYSLTELTGPDAPRFFRVYKWDGRTTVPIVDSANRVVGVLAGQPDDPAWGQVHESAAAALEKARLQLNTRRRKKKKKGKNSHRRGDFAVLNDGITHGTGQMVSAHTFWVCGLLNNA